MYVVALLRAFLRESAGCGTCILIIVALACLVLKVRVRGADAPETDNISILISNIIIPVCREKTNFERKLYQTVVRRRMEN